MRGRFDLWGCCDKGEQKKDNNTPLKRLFSDTFATRKEATKLEMTKKKRNISISMLRFFYKSGKTPKLLITDHAIAINDYVSWTTPKIRILSFMFLRHKFLFNGKVLYVVRNLRPLSRWRHIGSTMTSIKTLNDSSVTYLSKLVVYLCSFS